MHATDGEYTQWIGRTETIVDDLAPAQAMAAAAMFDLPDQTGTRGVPLPPLWQWFYFLGRAPQRALSADGHPPRGDFLPPIPYPRRMFAGGRLTFHRPLIVGEPAERRGEIRDITHKQGRSGNLAFVRVGYLYVQAGEVAIEEEQEIVYRQPGPPTPLPSVVAPRPPEPGVVSRLLHPDTRLLFRFSALTFNAHRIHYDRDYAMREEGYPGLVVHGPLLAMQLIALAHDAALTGADSSHGARIGHFEFRSERPVFDGAAYRLEGRPSDQSGVSLSVIGPDGLVAQRASARWA